jgi:FMN phosphatase YigB (HAD superfamily)
MQTKLKSPSPKISLVITDLDNTLYDWVGTWHKWFVEMIQYLKNKSGCSENTIELEFAKLHKRYQTVEFNYSLEEIESLINALSLHSTKEIYEEINKLYLDANLQFASLYPNVLHSLLKIKNTGALIVGFTDSPKPFSLFRVKELKLDKVIDRIYGPDLDFNSRSSISNVSSSNNTNIFDFKKIPLGMSKPNQAILDLILNDYNISRTEAIYIGDSLIRDVSMAKSASVIDVWAKYGDSINRPEYDLLRRVSHWSKQKIDNEKLLSTLEIKPTYCLESSFKDILDFFDFVPPCMRA